MSRTGIEHRASKVSMANGLSTILSIAFQLVSVPICLKYWGKESYGSWLALYASFMLVRSLDSGFVAYVGNKLNYLYHQDQKALCEHLASSLVGIAIISTLQLSIGLGAIFSDRIGLLLGINSNSAFDYHSSLALLVLIGTWVLSGSYLGIVHRLQIPAGLMYQAAWWAMGFQVSQFSGVILAAVLHFDMLQASLLFAFIQFSIYLASAIYIRIKLPTYYPWWRNGKLRTGIKDLRSSILLMVTNVIQQGVGNGTIILISALSGAASIPIFTTVRTLANLWTNVTNVLTSPLLPEIVRFHATGEGQKLVTISKVYWVIVGSIVNIGVLVSYPLIEPLYVHWTAHTVTLDKSLLGLLLASVVLANVGGLIALYLNGINRLGIVLSVSIIRGISILAVGTGLFFHFGLAGFGMGILAGELLVLLLMGYYFIKHELSRQNVRMPILSLAPVIVSTVSVIMFLANESLSFTVSPYIYPAALLGVTSSAIWGWKLLEPGLRARLVRMFGVRFFKKSTV